MWECFKLDLHVQRLAEKIVLLQEKVSANDQDRDDMDAYAATNNLTWLVWSYSWEAGWQVR